MSERLSIKSDPATAVSFTPARSGLLQRKCACGGAPGPTGECAECRKKRPQRKTQNAERGTRNDSTVPSTVPSIVHEVLRSPGQPLDAERRAFMEPRFGHDFSQVPASASRQAAQAQGGPTNSFDDCPIDWQRKADAALARGRLWVANVITGLANLPEPVPAPVATLLNRHFHTTRRDQIREISNHFSTNYNSMNAPIDFECETDCDDNVAAYVYSFWSDLHLCPIWYSLSPDGQANTIIHEIAHDAANRDDEAYVWQAKYATLSAEDAIDNADSYSNFAEGATRP